jgi:hypothetical protein
MNWKDLTPEQRRENVRKAALTRAGKKSATAAQAASASPPAASEPAAPMAERPLSLAELGLPVEEDALRVDDILTNEEIEEIRRDARARVKKEKAAERRKAFLALAMDEARREAGTMPLNEEEQKLREEMVEVEIKMPQLKTINGRELPPEAIILDGYPFHSGRRYKVSRAQAVTLVDRMGQAFRHVAQVDGRSKNYYSDQVGTIYQGGHASGGASSLSFMTLHRRPG